MEGEGGVLWISLAESFCMHLYVLPNPRFPIYILKNGIN